MCVFVYVCVGVLVVEKFNLYTAPVIALFYFFLMSSVCVCVCEC